MKAFSLLKILLEEREKISKSPYNKKPICSAPGNLPPGWGWGPTQQLRNVPKPGGVRGPL